MYLVLSAFTFQEYFSELFELILKCLLKNLFIVYSEYKLNLLHLIGNYVGKENTFIELGAQQGKLRSIFMVLHAAGKGLS